MRGRDSCIQNRLIFEHGTRNCRTEARKSATETTRDETRTRHSNRVHSDGIKCESETLPAVDNSSSPSRTDEHKHLWEEVAMRYQQILHREYRMLNLPSYARSEGNLYFYYVPVIINPILEHKHPSCDKKPGHETSTSKSEEVIHIPDDDDDHCLTGVKKEQVKIEPKTENSCSFRDYLAKKESPKVQDASSEMVKAVYGSTLQIKKEKDFGNENACIESEMKRKSETFQQSANYSNEWRLEEKEGHIRIFKGYTIEYHPLMSDGLVRPSQVESHFDKRGIKVCMAEQEEELEKLGERPFTEENFYGIVKRKKVTRDKCPSQISWGRPRDYPSVEIHYFPSGERKTSPPRRNARKQALPRRICIRNKTNPNEGSELCSFAKLNKMDSTVNKKPNYLRSKRKRKLTLPSVFQQEIPLDRKTTNSVQSRSNKCGRRLVKGRKKIIKATPVSRIFGQNLRTTASQNNCMEEESETLNCKASMPQDLNQDEFLSICGLVRISGQLNSSP
ncbi:uncharacterized protein LOC114976056 isoform X2 [Acropora millepora]|uniref:uncharacterized protein LOC114976056 isoform X2 n=1 Tax=Acropora millepora TaxID=45264 RepID=UPI001CF5DF2C|nr:uncharacterized protein LOC114976056 isoform X2 [Acropora millepora]